MNHATLTAALVALGFFSVEAGSFQRSNGNVIIGVDCFDHTTEITYIVGCRVAGTWEAKTVEAVLAELKAADANFFGYPGYQAMMA